MPLVRDAAEALAVGIVRNRRRIPLAALAAGVLATAALAGCGGDSQPAEQGIGVNAALQLADCDDWIQAGPEQRLTTVRQLREFSGGPVGEIDARGKVLDDEDAYDLLERFCAADYAAKFKLYKLYVRAAAFTGH